VSGPAVLAGTLDPGHFARRLRTGLGLRFGAFDFRIAVRVPGLAHRLQWLYADYPVLDDDRVHHAHVALEQTHRRPGSPARVRFLVDGLVPHEDRPAAHALAVLEWGLNLVIAVRFQGYLLLHAAVLERDGRALLLPAMPGHGKSTLCAALVHRGWRLLSDEFGILRPGSIDLLPLARPIALKNESIEVLRTFAPEARFGPCIEGTHKGTVAHLRAPAASVARAAQAAPAAWIVFPRWVDGAQVSMQAIAPTDSFLSLAMNAFNYEMLGEPAFDTVESIVAASRSARLRYSKLDAAIEAIDAWVRSGDA